jgi:hypothetical protein
MMAREVYCPTCRRTHTLPSYDGERVTPARVVWESIVFLFIVVAIIYGIPVIAVWMAVQ